MKITIQTTAYDRFKSPEPIKSWDATPHIHEELKIMSRTKKGLINYTAQKTIYEAYSARTEVWYDEDGNPEHWIMIQVKGELYELAVHINYEEEEIFFEQE